MSRLRKTAAAVFAVIACAGLIAAGTAAVAPPARAGSITDRGPSAGVDDKGNEYVFWRGTGGQLEEAWWSVYSSHWYGPIDLGMGTLGSEPSVAVAPDQNNGCEGGHNECGWQYVYWEGTGPSHDLWMAYWGDGSWHGPIDLGMGALGSQPAASASSPVTLGHQELDVYWKGIDGNLWYAYSDSGFTAPGDYSGPHAASYHGHGLGALGSSPSASVAAQVSCVSSFCAYDDYVTWQGGNGALWYAEYDLASHAWDTGATQSSCCGTLGGPPSIAAEVSYSPTAPSSIYDLVWQGAGGSYNLWTWSTDAPVAIDLGMGTLGSAPTVAFRFLGNVFYYQLYVFWKGSSDASLYEAYYDRKTETWHGPIDLGMGPLG